MAVTDAPEDHHQPLRATTTATRSTRYEATGGYEGLEGALAKTPAEVIEEVKSASLLGRGGAGFPAGVKWGFCPPGVWPRYLVVNGDESEPGTYKDRLLMEKDPHQLIEGVLIACYAVGCCAGVPLRPRRDGARPGAHRPGPQRRLRRRLRRQEHPRHRLLASTSSCTGVPVPTSWARRRRSSRASRATGACPGSSRRSSRPPRACTCSRPSSTTSRRWPTCRGSSSNGGAAFAALGCRELQGHPDVRRVGSRQEPRRVRGRVRRHHLPRPHLRRPSTAAASAAASELKAFIPGGASAPWFYEEHLDLPLEAGIGRQARHDARLGRHRRDGRDHRHGQGLPARSCASSPASRCGKCTPCREGTSWLEKILAAHPRRPRPPRGPRPPARRVRQHLRRHELAAQADHDLPARASRPPRRSPRRSCASRTSSRPTSAAPPRSPSTVKGPAFVGPVTRRAGERADV